MKIHVDRAVDPIKFVNMAYTHILIANISFVVVLLIFIGRYIGTW